MYKKTVIAIFIAFLFASCATKQPIKNQTATIVFKTPVMKFYDKGFITKYDNHIHLQVLNVGQVVLDLKIYKNQICQSTLECLSAKEFNKIYLSDQYDEQFLYKLFSGLNIRFKDKEKNILIKVIKD